MGVCSSSKTQKSISTNINLENNEPKNINSNSQVQKENISTLVDPYFCKLIIKYDNTLLTESNKLETNDVLLTHIKNLILNLNTLNRPNLPSLSEDDYDCFSYFLLNKSTNKFEDITLKLECKLNNFTKTTFVPDDIQTLEINVIYTGIKISKDVIISYSSTELIGKPIEDTLDILIYNKTHNNFEIYSFGEETTNKEFLNKYSYYSAYCNEKNRIFISGGDSLVTKDGETIRAIHKFFISIDLETKEIKQLPDLLEPKTWHSMIYIPDEFIFIVGGEFSNEVECYNTQTNTITNEASLNEKRCESSLCCVNSRYLYAFCGFDNDKKQYIDSIERLNLRKRTRQWEIVQYKFGDITSFDSRFFSLLVLDEKRILIIGGVDITKINSENTQKNYVFNLENNTIDSVEIEGKNDCFFSEKQFIPISRHEFALIPLAESNKVIFFNNGVFRTLQNLDSTLVGDETDIRLVNQGSKSNYNK